MEIYMCNEHKILPTSKQYDNISHLLLQGIRRKKKEKDNNNNNTQQLTSKSKPMKLERNQKKRKAVFKPRAIYQKRTISSYREAFWFTIL